MILDNVFTQKTLMDILKKLSPGIIVELFIMFLNRKILYNCYYCCCLLYNNDNNNNMYIFVLILLSAC